MRCRASGRGSARCAASTASRTIPIAVGDCAWVPVWSPATCARRTSSAYAAGSWYSVPVSSGCPLYPSGKYAVPDPSAPSAYSLMPAKARRLAAQPPRQPHRQHVVQQRGHDQHLHPQPEAAVRVPGQVRLHLASRHLGVHDRRDACAQECVLCVLEQSRPARRGFGQVDVRAVPPDLHPIGSGQQVAGRVPDQAVRRAIVVSADLATGHIGRVPADAVRRQPEGVEHATMAAHVHDVDLAVGSGAVQLGRDRVAELGVDAVVVARTLAAAHRAGGWWREHAGPLTSSGMDGATDGPTSSHVAVWASISGWQWASTNPGSRVRPAEVDLHAIGSQHRRGRRPGSRHARSGHRRPRAPPPGPDSRWSGWARPRTADRAHGSRLGCRTPASGHHGEVERSA